MPANNVTRAELCKLIVVAYGFTQDGQATEFTDTNGHWASNYIAIASSLQIVKGYEDNTFRPDSGISREELAVMISRAMYKKNVGTNISDANIDQNLAIFIDNWSIDTWA